MNFYNLTLDSWRTLISPNSKESGYKSIWLGIRNEPAGLHIFKDDKNIYHFAIEHKKKKLVTLTDPKINGLGISLKDYKVNSKRYSSFIDIECKIVSFLPEFTKVVVEICEAILLKKIEAVSAVNQTINKWIAFWDNEKIKCLTEEEQLGLIAEISVLIHFCRQNPDAALDSWVGPIKERHDFIFSKFSVEVKCTKKKTITHTINGIEQLEAFPGKKLFLISILASSSTESGAKSLPEFINEFYKTVKNQPALIVKFNKILTNTGYSPMHNEYYLASKFLLLSKKVFLVDDNFPRITNKIIKYNLAHRISSIRYDISLDGLPSKDLIKFKF